MQTLKGHSGLVQLLGVYEDDTSIYLALELVTGGDLCAAIATVTSTHMPSTTVTSRSTSIMTSASIQPTLIHINTTPYHVILSHSYTLFILPVMCADGSEVGVHGGPCTSPPLSTRHCSRIHARPPCGRIATSHLTPLTPMLHIHTLTGGLSRGQLHLDLKPENIMCMNAHNQVLESDLSGREYTTGCVDVCVINSPRT